MEDSDEGAVEVPAEPTVSPLSVVEDGVELGAGVIVWDHACIREDACLGSGSTVGRGAFIDVAVVIGSNCKIQNNAMIYTPARLSDGVFVGPAAILTNDRWPRAVGLDGHRIGPTGWTRQGIVVEEGASIGAGSTIVAGVRLGKWSMVGAGAIVTKDVEPFSLVVGVPARQVGWVGRAGSRLVTLDPDRGEYACSRTNDRYQLTESGMELLDG